MPGAAPGLVTQGWTAQSLPPETCHLARAQLLSQILSPLSLHLKNLCQTRVKGLKKCNSEDENKAILMLYCSAKKKKKVSFDN